MKLLLDAHLLLWAAGHPDRLSAEVRGLIANPENELLFSEWCEEIRQFNRSMYLHRAHNDAQ